MGRILPDGGADPRSAFSVPLGAVSIHIRMAGFPLVLCGGIEVISNFVPIKVRASFSAQILGKMEKFMAV